MANASSTGHFAMVPKHVVKSHVSFAAKTLWTALALHCRQKDLRVWVHRPYLAQMLDCTTEYVRRCLQELIEANLILPTNELYRKRFPYFVLNFDDPKAESKPEAQDETLADYATVQPADDNYSCGAQATIVATQQNKEIKLIKENNNNINTATTSNCTPVEKALDVDVVSFENSQILKSLCDNGIQAPVAKMLVEIYGEDKCAFQIQHLQKIVDAGTPVQNPAGWLVNAIKRGYQMPKELHEAPAKTDAAVPVDAAVARTARPSLREEARDDVIACAKNWLNWENEDTAQDFFDKALNHDNSSETRALIAKAKQEVAEELGALKLFEQGLAESERVEIYDEAKQTLNTASAIIYGSNENAERAARIDILKKRYEAAPKIDTSLGRSQRQVTVASTLTSDPVASDDFGVVMPLSAEARASFASVI